jgi:hypothetical protein
MSTLTVADTIVSLATLTALLVLFYGPWQSVCTDISRQFIFERRDKLFDMAIAGRLSFDSEAYRATRRTLNGMLRFAHTITWQELVIGFYFIQKTRAKLPDWRESLADLPVDVRNDVEATVKECTATLTGLVALKSIFIGPTVFALAFVIGCTKGTSWLLRSVASQERLEPLSETIETTSAEFVEAESMALAA